ncbi:hypothetical protein [Flavobacterium microcysteis]|uniref:Uncharacterized protein n=1 Tax=Flavobacterium microcysteis TaxID=2596891 RepID=A0A501QDU8_9FLAO|nr:hypothetical protein [Flavobacterium microcysteis]TPD70572.1 hypothetical protein FJA49_06440 [Flavobacterium microcysteis]
MKSYYPIILLFIPYYMMSQDRAIRAVDSCKTISDNKVLVFNKENSDFSLKFNDETSYITIFFGKDDNDVQFKRIRLSELNPADLKDKEYALAHNFIYDIVYKGYSIHRTSLGCDSEISDELEYYIDIMKDLKKGKLISPITAIEIAKKNGFDRVLSCELEDDPRWKGPGFYEENEKKWKVTWTLKTKSKLDVGLDVIKLNAKNGKVLDKYIEFPID